MAFEEQLPQWENEGTQPPQSKRVEGWLPNEKPPASWFNWLFGRTYKVLQELRSKVALKTDVEELAGPGRTTETVKGNADALNAHLDEMASLGIGIDVDPPLSEDLDQETSMGWVRYTSTTLNRPAGMGLSSDGLVRIERRYENRVVQTAYGVAGGSGLVAIAVRFSASTGFGDWVRLITSASDKIIAESGDNENGSYLRFADGTQICWNDNVINFTSESEAWTEMGGVYRSPNVPVVFPASFTSPPLVIPQIRRTGGNRFPWAGPISTLSVTQGDMFFFSHSGTAPIATAGYYAIGRWKL